MHTKNIGKFKLYFDPKIDLEKEVEEKILTANEKNKAFFGCSLKNKHEIHFLYGREEMDKILGKKTEPWLVGTTTKDGSIFIFSPTVFDKVSNHPVSDFDPVLTHELAHIFTNEVCKFYQPVWLKEGIAGHIAGQHKNKWPKKVSNFENLHKKGDWDNAPNYTQATNFVSFLIEKFGEKKILQFLKNLSENVESQKKFFAFSKLFSGYFNFVFKEIVQEWKKKVPSQVKPEGH